MRWRRIGYPSWHVRLNGIRARHGNRGASLGSSVFDGVVLLLDCQSGGGGPANDSGGVMICRVPVALLAAGVAALWVLDIVLLVRGFH